MNGKTYCSNTQIVKNLEHSVTRTNDIPSQWTWQL